jgi:hypothetical protein
MRSLITLISLVARSVPGSQATQHNSRPCPGLSSRGNISWKLDCLPANAVTALAHKLELFELPQRWLDLATQADALHERFTPQG